MKLSNISLAAAALFGIAAAPAHALLASSYTNASEFSGDTMNIRISGATAQDPGLLASSIRNCTAGSMTRYSISNTFVYFCTPDTTKVTMRPGTTKLAIHKYSVGGSGSGVGFVNAATPIAFLDLAKVASSCVPSASSTVDIDGAGPLSSFQDIACAAATTAVTTATPSYIGISDVEPSFFGVASTYNNLASGALASVIFGVPVTKNVYEALQGAQGKTVGSLLEVDMPSLTQAQLTSMYTQEGQTWSGLTGTAIGDDMVYVARRASTSGTQKSFEAVVARTANSTSGAKSCNPGVDGFVSGPDALNNAAAVTACNGSNLVVNNSGSGQVIACMDTHQTGGRGAIGVLSTEYKSTVGGNVRFVKVNGLAPTHANVASGGYQQYTDAALNTRIGATLPTASALGYSAYVTRMKSDFSDPAIVAVINAGPQPFGNSGLMSLDVLETTVPVADYTGAQSRNPWSRLNSGLLNNCQSGRAAAF